MERLDDVLWFMKDVTKHGIAAVYRPILLLLDIHQSHLLERVLDFSKEKKVMSFPRHTIIEHIKKTPCSEFASELHRPRDRRLSVK
jgi:hypothetical protein